ncbi:MAG: hypothetical protein A3I44_01545 [Candidatus Sungbacteria bacterium RIFCSPLOWO2_02_FULL_51_17]|uniref:HlyC/CorC family transporter n=1 Tax=Candidatus Sungbacteria bacterium RIFCSPHIGHO2_02_FULL_51_29 TaxID=1802273 RepID=A0A1G2KYV6_9BACT|nr:MAG: hypothetical protein A2676_05810 [Candidatus Sungbacteria bacterium RIFCSPHIGHO2_01_FULL_51_22]OHA03661.1 MAG: hypothetical protein A3C16_03410 [Candidatus Sungbacteria bacterium RIFCSPHIGHO2_02_FULL_51_29]OHA06388.1 MAG: hypothetical protein A3B29_04600 [Candidatus Sungbacteria bacterium RIFCSPLOWO2_01_FULL_51_34]OHA12358.1 MAG: hypothetical protein A3I44_01545 [Candidatus Sungbacteria bacterium RIFCSPLOWO2_02_FULL_51_17]
MIILLVLAAFVVCASGILSMVEASLFSYSLTTARLRAARGAWGAKAALEIRARPFRAIATFVILSSTINVVGSIAIGSYAAFLFSSRGIGMFSAIFTFCTIILAEIIPKNIGERWNQMLFPIAAGPLLWLSFFMTPLVVVLEAITRPFTSGVSPFTTSEEEIALLAGEGARAGSIEPYEAEMIRRVFRLNDVTAGDMMTPKPFVSLMNGDTTVADAVGVVKNAKWSRFPVYTTHENSITGMVYARDILRAFVEGEAGRKVSEYAREAMIVPEGRLGDDLLRDFQARRTHLAVVVSEYGNVVGVVGLEDVLEELVGEIIDEKDVQPELIKRVAKHEIIAHGQTRVSLMNHFFNTTLKSRKTLNGFLQEKLGHIPKAGDVYEFEDLVFRVEEASAQQVERVRVQRKLVEEQANA